MDDREQVPRAEPRVGGHGMHGAEARDRAATSTVQSCGTLAEHGWRVVATVVKLSRRMRNSRFDPQERIPYGLYLRCRRRRSTLSSLFFRIFRK
jgi:hypothetical protein